MDKIFAIIDSFERTAMLYIFRFRKFFWPKSVEKVSKKIDEVVSDYNELIEEFKLIKQGKSTKSKKHRDIIEVKIAFLIDKGHISFGK